ncbi:hypothetical protein C8J56DRAFT_1061482 [Mycena floridula]|nr:hypothetical protein C8J56DRAFT_1061482 [Mycena floridula]
MPRPKIHRSKAAKRAADANKAKKWRDKNKLTYNAKHREQYADTKKSEAGIKLNDPELWAVQADTISRIFSETVVGSAPRYLQLLCEEFKDQGNKSEFFKMVKTVLNLCDQIKRCQKSMAGSDASAEQQLCADGVQAEVYQCREWLGEIWKEMRKSSVDTVKRFIAGGFQFQSHLPSDRHRDLLNLEVMSAGDA